jgi:uncharacterized protein involved in oxidation of intracellular sulfur
VDRTWGSCGAFSVCDGQPTVEDSGSRDGNAVLCAKAWQKTPDGYYNLERMLGRVLSDKGRVLMCGTCMDARGLVEGDMMEGATRSNMDELAQATLAADKVLVF